MIEKFIKLKDGLEYLLGNIDSAGRTRRSEIVGGCFLPAVREARKAASKFKEPEITFSYRDPNPIEEMGGEANLKMNCRKRYWKHSCRGLTEANSTICLFAITIRIKVMSLTSIWSG